ncbi:MAG: lysophospholipid acyltransferase family protein [Chloroflexota bacterium]
MSAYIGFRLGSAIVSLLPYVIGYYLALAAGELSYWLQGRRRANVQANLRRVLGTDLSETDLRRQVRGVFRNGAIHYLDLLRLPRLRLDEVDKRIHVHGFENLERARAGGKGVIVVTAHMGSFDTVLQIMAVRKVPLVVPAEPVKPRRLFDFVTSLRSSQGVRFVAAETGVMFALVKSLKRNEVIGLAVDRDWRGDGISLEWCGAVATFQPGAALLARRLGTPIVPAFAIRRPDNVSEVFVEPPLAIMASDDQEADVRENMRRILDVVARYIRTYPDQWVAFEPVWRGQKDD